MICSVPRYGTLGRMHELRNRRHGGIDLLSSGSPTALVSGFAGENHVSGILPRELVLLLRWSSVLGWWWGWMRQSFSLCNPSHKITLPSGMRRRPARSAVQLARCIQHIIKRVLALHLSLLRRIGLHLPTASCISWIFPTLDSGHLPTALLSIWLRILALPIL